MRPPALEACAAGLAISTVATWVLDPDTLVIMWINRAGLALWRAEDLAELTRRDIIADAPAKVLTRLRSTLARVLDGEVLREEWVFYPRGQPTTVLLHLSAIELADGRVGMLNQATPLDGQLAPSVARAIMAMRHLSAIVAYLGDDGELRMQNPAAIEEFGDQRRYEAWFVDPAEARQLLRAATDDGEARTEVRVRGLHGERWHAVEAHRVRDPIFGDLGTLTLHRDETARRDAEHMAAARLDQLDEQRQEILALSAPLLEVGSHTLALPIIGRLDATRAYEITERLLTEIVARRIRRAVLDLTGVAEVDPATVQHLRAMIGAIRLLGARPVITGVRPALATTLAEAGVSLEDTAVLRNLADALNLPSARSPSS